MISVGVRIEFYEHAFEGEPPQGLLGRVERPDGYRALAVPAVGDIIKGTSLRLGTREEPYPLPGPLELPVRRVEHYLVPERDGEVPAWWDSYTEPGAIVVLYVSLSLTGSETRRRMIRQFVADGWVCDGAAEGSELREFVLQAREELGL